MTDSKSDIRTVGIVTLATLAGIAALYVGRDVLVPLAVAAVLCVLLRPAVRLLEGLRVPTPLAAGLVMLALVGVLVGVGFALAAPLRAWASKAPEHFTSARDKLEGIRQPIQKVTEAVRKAEGALNAPTTAPASRPAGDGGDALATTREAAGPVSSDAVSAAQSAAPSPAPGGALPMNLAGHVLGTTTQIVGGATGVLLLLLLLLASGRMFPDKLLRVLPTPQGKVVATEVMTQSAAVTIRYVIVTAFINASQGLIVALVMWWIGMPTPWLWGVFTLVLEFVPFLGAIIVMILLAVTALASLDGVGRILLAPGSYLIITTLQNNLVSPIAYGNRLKLNPVVVLLCVLFWYFVWGVPGAFIAVPITAMIKILADHVERLRVVAEFLGE